MFSHKEEIYNWLSHKENTSHINIFQQNKHISIQN